MPNLIDVGQHEIQLPNSALDYACGVAATISVVWSLTGSSPRPMDVLNATSTCKCAYFLGSTPKGIANYLIAQGLQVSYSTPTRHSNSPLVALLWGHLKTGRASKHSISTVLPIDTLNIHLIKPSGCCNPSGHYIVSDGIQFMDPWPPGGHTSPFFPGGYYDTGLTLIVHR